MSSSWNKEGMGVVIIIILWCITLVLSSLARPPLRKKRPRKGLVTLTLQRIGWGKQHNIGQAKFIWVDKICPQLNQLDC